VTDVMMPQLYKLTPQIAEVLQREARGACAVVASHPYLYPALEGLGLPIWYEAQDFELDLKTTLFEKLPRGRKLIDAVREVDEKCTRAAEVLLCASPRDVEKFATILGAPRDRLLEVPNGTDTQRIVFAGRAEREALRRRLGIADAPIAFFMGSGHWPNIEAVKRVFELATALAHVAFAVVGSVCHAFDPKLKPANVLFMGEVDDVTRNLCLQAFDVALNPMEHGSGTNIKMLDYFSAGLPVITTERGARGLPLEGEAQCLVRPVDGFTAAIEEVVGEGAARAALRAEAARRLVEDEFDWDAIVRRVKPRLVALADRGPSRRARPEAGGGAR
jgi:glycosyltransferase involved in cell wall biosynthesis